jgi:hypothetical protein
MLVVDGTSGLTFNDSSLQGAAASPYVLKNRIINGAMAIDQRNAGASFTPTADGNYTLDRWVVGITQSSKFSVQQTPSATETGYATRVGAGFTNYLAATSLSAYTIGAGDIFIISQKIEGLNVSDLAWGTSSAKTVTLSFWVYSSLTGTFGGSLKNSAANRSYPFSYTISSANTWTQVSVTIAGDTTGTWLTTNGIGIIVNFSLGTGSTYSGTAGSWAATNYTSATGATSVVGTNGATFYITGVQLEIGTSATPFERRLYNQELANCQRYYYRTTAGAVGVRFSVGQVYSTTNSISETQFPVPMRTAPAALEQNGTAAHYAVLNSGAAGLTCTSVPTFNLSSNILAETIFIVASGLVAGNATVALGLNATAYLGWSAEL